MYINIPGFFLGHVYSWGFGYPDILTQCYTNSRKVQGYYGPLNPARNSTFAFLKKLFTEVMDVFPEKVLHLGGDEVPLECWLVILRSPHYYLTHIKFIIYLLPIW